MNFIQIATGEYTYRDNDGELNGSHSVYGLDENGVVWKYIVHKKVWIRLEDLDFKYD
jgi:hypothetical protein